MRIHRTFRVPIIVLCVGGALGVPARSGSTADGHGGLKDVDTASAAIRGEAPDATGETYGVVGTSSSPDGAGLGAVNTVGGPDLVLDGAEAGEADLDLYEWGVDRSSTDPQAFSFRNLAGGGISLWIDGELAVTTATDQDTLGGLSCDPWQIAKWNGSNWGCYSDRDALRQLSCADGQIARFDGAVWICDEDRGITFETVAVVSPVGDWQQNGTALLDAISGLPPGTTAVIVEPGWYDLGAESLDVPSGVSLIGFANRSRIVSTVCNQPTLDSPAVATVVLRSVSRLQDLEVRNECDEPTAAAVAVLSTDASTIDNVTMRASGDANACFGLYAIGSVTVTGGLAFGNCPLGVDYGIYVEGDGFAGGVELLGCRAVGTFGGAAIRVEDPGARLQGVYAGVTATGTGLELAGDGIRVEGTEAAGGSGGNSITVTGGERVTLSDIIVFQPIVIDGSGTSAVVNGCVPDPTYSSSFDLEVTGGALAEVMNSKLATVNVGPGTAKIGASRLQSVVVGTGGSATCAGVWNSSFTFYPSTCP